MEKERGPRPHPRLVGPVGHKKEEITKACFDVSAAKALKKKNPHFLPQGGVNKISRFLVQIFVGSRSPWGGRRNAAMAWSARKGIAAT